MGNPKIIVGCPVRNRAWILPEYLKALNKIDYAEKGFVFLVNDCEDDSFEIIDTFEHRAVFKWTKPMNFGSEHWDRGAYAHNQYENLANVRNTFLEMFLFTDWDYLLSVDSDIIVPPDIIHRLLEHADEQTIVGATISNIPGQPVNGANACNFMQWMGTAYSHPATYPTTGIMNVDVIGAVYLIPRQAIEAGVRYGPHPLGEDIPFCESAQEAGFMLRVLLDLVCEHRMVKTERCENHG